MTNRDAGGIDFEPPVGMPLEASRKQQIIKRYLRARKEAGFSYVNANDIRRGLDWDPMPQAIGSNLRALEQKGVLEKRAYSSPITYRIVLEGDDG